MKPRIKIAFATGTDELNAQLIKRMRAVFPELPLYVVSDFPPADADLVWVRYRGSLAENLARCRHAFRGKSIRLAGVVLVPNVPFRRMRLLALILAPLYFLAMNEHLNDFMLRPASLPAIVRHILWRAGNFFRWHTGKQGWLSQRGWDDLPYIAGLAAGWLRFRWRPKNGGKQLTPGLTSAEFFCAVSDGRSRKYVIRGGDASAYDPDKMRELGGLSAQWVDREIQDFDLCYRAWQRGWPCAADASAPESVPVAISTEYLRLLARRTTDPKVFRDRWNSALDALHASAKFDEQARTALWKATAIALGGGPAGASDFPEDLFLALTEAECTIYAGRAPSGKPRLLIASAYLPFPLSHGGAVRMYNLVKRAAAEFDQVLVCFVETDAAPAPELLDCFVEIVLVCRIGSHDVALSERPEVVEQFHSKAFSAGLRLAVKKWQPAVAQLEFTQMAQYAPDCSPARPVLIEHDITFDLYQQMARTDADWDLHREMARWHRFETRAWREMAAVVTMSAKDRAFVTETRSVALPNGVDLERFGVAQGNGEPHRLLFIGSFSHLPNLIAVRFFVEDAWRQVRAAVPDATLHIIAGANHEYFLEYQSRHVQLNLDQPGIEVEGFVSDVRPAYGRAAIVIAPLVASAGTNLKILEAMACGRPVVSTSAGVNGLDLAAGEEFALANTGAEIANAILRLFNAPEECASLAAAGRRRVEESYGWDEIARKQAELYRELIRQVPAPESDRS